MFFDAVARAVELGFGHELLDTTVPVAVGGNGHLHAQPGADGVPVRCGASKRATASAVVPLRELADRPACLCLRNHLDPELRHQLHFGVEVLIALYDEVEATGLAGPPQDLGVTRQRLRNLRDSLTKYADVLGAAPVLGAIRDRITELVDEITSVSRDSAWLRDLCVLEARAHLATSGALDGALNPLQAGPDSRRGILRRWRDQESDVFGDWLDMSLPTFDALDALTPTRVQLPGESLADWVWDEWKDAVRAAVSPVLDALSARAESLANDPRVFLVLASPTSRSGRSLSQLFGVPGDHPFIRIPAALTLAGDLKLCPMVDVTGLGDDVLDTAVRLYDPSDPVQSSLTTVVEMAARL